MAYKHVVIFAILFQFCDSSTEFRDSVKYGANGDTIELVKYYPMGQVCEVVYYQKNGPADNIGFYRDGKRMNVPQLVFNKEDNTIFSFFPISIADTILSSEILIG